jgi:plastocyanin
MPTTTLRRAIVVSAGAAMFMAASADFSAVQAQESNAVVIKNFMFSPMSLTVKAGSTVTWKNLDGEPHIVVNDAGLFRSGALDQNDTFQFKFDKPGVYNVFCAIHPYMKQTITIK